MDEVYIVVLVKNVFIVHVRFTSSGAMVYPWSKVRSAVPGPRSCSWLFHWTPMNTLVHAALFQGCLVQ